MAKMMITCAVTGAETTKQDNPNLPVTPEEIAQSSYEAYLAGAAIIHLHVRDENELATQDSEIFKKAIKLIKEKCDVIVEITTGGAVGMTDEERMSVLKLQPEMASLDCGTMNFGNEHILNTLPTMRAFAKEFKAQGVKPTLECFDLSHIYAAHTLIKEGLLEPPYNFCFVLNVPGGVRYDVETLDFMVRRLPENSIWTVMGVGGRASVLSHSGALSLGGHMRVGFEDNVYYGKGILAESNAQLVERAANFAKVAGFEIATPDDVREMLELKGAK